jgi:hypothetical protein
MPLEMSDLSAERVEERQVERYAKINRHNYLYCLYQKDSLSQTEKTEDLAIVKRISSIR